MLLVVSVVVDPERSWARPIEKAAPQTPTPGVPPLFRMGPIQLTCKH